MDVTNNITTGIRLPFDATLVAITGRASGGDTSRLFSIRKNGSATNLLSFTVNSLNYTDTTTDLDFNAGEYITVFIENEPGPGTNIDNPVVALFLKWRK